MTATDATCEAAAITPYVRGKTLCSWSLSATGSLRSGGLWA